MKRCLLIIGVVALACSSQAPEHPESPKEIRLPIDLPQPSIIRRTEGWITGPNKEPLRGALVSTIDQRSYRGIGFSFSDRDGRFSLGLPSTPVVVTVTANGYVGKVLIPDASNQIAVVLEKPSGATRRFAGTVVDITGRPISQVRVRLMHWSWPSTAFYTTSDKTGKFQFSAEAEGSYDLMVDDSRYISNFAPLVEPHLDKALLIAYERERIKAEASHADESALHELCVPMTGNGIRQFVGSLRDTRVVGLGESTHGTREFTELRSSLIEELARNGWLTTIALEASWKEVIHLDNYVRRGQGTGRDAVKSLAYWPWRTEEFLRFVESVRKLNDELDPDNKIEFVGIDYTPPRATTDSLRRHFEKEGSVHQDVLSRLDVLQHITNWLERSSLSQREIDSLLRTLSELSRIAENQVPISLPTIQGLQITQRILQTSGNNDDFRDRVMAEAILALLLRSDKQRHIAIWAHGLHLAQGPIEGSLPMGHYLRSSLVKKYRAIGTMFYEGSFRTYSALQKKLVNHVVTLPPAFYFESAMHRASPSGACILDVAGVTRGSRVYDWLTVPKHVRVYGGLEISESYPWPPVVVPDLWSAMIFVPSTTPTTPL